MVDAGYGELKDFTGAPVRGHAPQVSAGIPADAVLSSWHINTPIECFLAGMEIKYAQYRESNYSSRYIYFLQNRWGHIVKQWPENKEPGIEEIRQAVVEALFKEGRRLS